VGVSLVGGVVRRFWKARSSTVDLEKRIDALEKEVRELRYRTYISRIKPEYRTVISFYPGPNMYYKYDVDKVLNMVLDHLKLDLNTTSAVPEQQALVKVEKK
jgi:hypothetical protein